MPRICPSPKKPALQTSEVRALPAHECQLTHLSDPVNYRIYEGIFIKFRRRIWRFLTVDPLNPQSKRILKSAALIWEEELRHLDHHSRVIHPFSQFRFVWETIMMFVWLVQLFCVPLGITSYLLHNAKEAVTVKTTMDFICHFDIIFWFFTGYYDRKEQKIVLTYPKILKRYLSTFFLVDVISSQPFHFYMNSEHHKHLVRCLMILFLFKLLRVPTMLTYFKHFSERTNLCTSNIKVISFTVWTCVLLAWFTSVIYMYLELRNVPIGVMEYGISDFSILTTAFKVIRVLMNVGITDKANRSDALMVTQVIFITVGACLHIVILAKVMQFYQKRSSSKSTYNSLREEIGQYMKYKELPTRLRLKIMRYFDFKFQKHIFKDEDILDNLSSVLKHDILMQRCQNMIERVEFFKGLGPQVILRIVSKLRSEIFLPNDVILLAGYTGNAMYFIYMGTVAVYTPNGKEICHLEEGSHFGEIALIINEPRVATVVAVKECELFRLNRKDFQEAIEPFPELNKRIRNLAMARLERTLKIMSEPSTSNTSTLRTRWGRVPQKM